MKCPYCGSDNVEKVKRRKVIVGTDVVFTGRCRDCGMYFPLPPERREPVEVKIRDCFRF